MKVLTSYKFVDVCGSKFRCVAYIASILGAGFSTCRVVSWCVGQWRRENIRSFRFLPWVWVSIVECLAESPSWLSWEGVLAVILTVCHAMCLLRMCEISYGLLDEKLSLQSRSIENMQKSSATLFLWSKVVFSISDLWEKSFISVAMGKLSENSRINSRLKSRLNSRPTFWLNNHRDQEFFEKCWALSTTLDQRNKVSELFCMFSIDRLCKDKFSSRSPKHLAHA